MSVDDSLKQESQRMQADKHSCTQSTLVEAPSGSVSRSLQRFSFQALSSRILEAEVIGHRVSFKTGDLEDPQAALLTIPALEIYFARFFGLTLVPIVAHVLLSLQAGNEDVRKANVYTTLFLHFTSALHVFNRFRLTRDPGLTRDVGGSLVLVGLGSYILYSDLV